MVEEINTNLDTAELPQNSYQAKDSEAASLANWIRRKTHGRHVRESIARFVELTSDKVFDAVQMTSETVRVANETQERLNQQIGALTEDSEVIDARGEFTVLGQRLRQTDDYLSELSRGNAKVYTNLMALVADPTIRVGDIAHIKGWHSTNDTKDMLFEIVDSTSDRLLNKRNANIAVHLANGLVALPQIENYLPMQFNNEQNVNELISVANTYFNNRTNFEYNADYAHAVFIKDKPSHINYDWKPLTPSGKYPIVCSDLTGLALSGVPYDKSRYINASGENTPVYDWSMLHWFKERNPGEALLVSDLDAHTLAKAAFQQGCLYTPNSDWSNMRRGDILFFSQTVEERGYGETDEQFLNIYHIAIYNGGGQIYQASSGEGVISIDNILTTPSFEWLKDDLVAFSRFPLNSRDGRYVAQYNAEFGTDNNGTGVKIKASDGYVLVTFDGTNTAGSKSGELHVGNITNEKLRPDSVIRGSVTTTNGKSFRVTIGIDGKITIFSNLADNQSGLQVYGSVTYPLANAINTYTTYK
ncbi:hypothetical protein ACV7JQ_07000 [Globicatella sulfidifaciens]